MSEKRVITEADIIAARQRVAAADAKGEQISFEDGLLASPDLRPQHIREWLEADVKVHWCTCKEMEGISPPPIICETCGRPPLWVTIKKEGSDA